MELANLENVAISCVTAEEAIACCSLASDLGLNWCTGASFKDKINWSDYKAETCYDFLEGSYCEISFFKSVSYKIQSADWFLENFKTKEEKEKSGSTLMDLYNNADSSTKKLSESRFSKEELGIKEELPNTWEEFCSKNNIKKGEVCIDAYSNIVNMSKYAIRNSNSDINLLPNEKTAKAFLALMQLIQLRDCYRDGWEPDWNTFDEKYCIYNIGNKIDTNIFLDISIILSFQSKEIRDKFYNNFKDLIEVAKEFI
jgi:hypothetical protein